MKTVLLLIHDDGGQEARLEAALDVTRALRGHLSCLDLVSVPAVAGDSIGSFASERRHESVNRQRVRHRLEAEDVPWDWIEPRESPDLALRRHCELADLIVVNGEVADLHPPDERYVAGSTAVRSGKPVLAVPRESRRFDASGSAMVLWDGSDPAAAATVAAVPILKLARSVTLYQFGDECSHTTREEAATYLSRHGIHAEIVAEALEGRSAAEAILKKAECGRYAYAVMGAYSTAPLIERLFGGVTRQMLRASPIPLILAH